MAVDNFAVRFVNLILMIITVIPNLLSSNALHRAKTLERIKERKDFYVYKCKNDDCSFFLNILNVMKKEDKKLFKLQPHNFKVRYIYRQFIFDFQALSKKSSHLPKVDISNIHSSLV